MAIWSWLRIHQTAGWRFRGGWDPEAYPAIERSDDRWQEGLRNIQAVFQQSAYAGVSENGGGSVADPVQQRKMLGGARPRL